MNVLFGSLSEWVTSPVETLKSTMMLLPAIIIGLTVHEWAHAYVAHLCGDETANLQGRMTLNPVAHLDLYGFLALLLLGFGWAKPVPVNPSRYKHFRRDDILVSIAGITMNLLTALVFTLLTWSLMAVFPDLIGNSAFKTIMFSVVSVNLSLMVFNLIPLYPLDGSHIFEALLMRRAPRVCFFLRSYGRYILLAILVLGLSSYVLRPIVSFIYGLLNRLGFALYSTLCSLLVR